MRAGILKPPILSANIVLLLSLQSYTSFVLRRPDLTPPPRLPKPSIPIDLDPLDSWQPYPQFSRSYPQRKIELLHQCIGLAEIVQQITRDFYSGKNEISHDLHHRFHAELLIWHDGYRKATSEMEGNIAPDLIIRYAQNHVFIFINTIFLEFCHFEGAFGRTGIN